MKTADVDILIPAYNCAAYLETAVLSTVAGFSGNARVLIVEDGSSDSTLQVATRLASRDSRVEVLENGRNLGIVEALNRGLDACTAPLIARMDGDDISVPGRLATQVAAMRSKSLALCGTEMQFVGKKKGYWTCPPEESYLSALLFRPPFGHSTAVLDRQWLLDSSLGYSKERPHAEDYDLWVRMEIAGAKRFLIRRPWVRYRFHQTSISRSNQKQQARAALETSLFFWEKIGLSATDFVRNSLLSCFSDDRFVGLDTLVEALSQLRIQLKPALIGMWGYAEYVRFCAALLLICPESLSRADVARIMFRIEPHGMLFHGWNRLVLNDRF